ncbi:MAG TPA: hypothetical protein VFR07_03720 [Mycobacteriales bacterium]|jgi:hypothetical protein|nr:hypothetical protein [Mycobacteriales bacterium]
MDPIRIPSQATALGARIPEPWLRAQLPVAVAARPLGDAVPRGVWRQVAVALEATAHAMACAQDGTAPTDTAALAAIAVAETQTAAVRVHAVLGRLPGPLREDVPRGTGRRPRLVPVERTWYRLAGLLAGPVPGDPLLLALVLADHRAALAQWQDVLLAPERLRQLPRAV